MHGNQPILDVRPRPHLLRGAHQYPDAAAPYLREELVLLRLGVGIVDECDLLLRHALRDELLLYVIVNIEAALARR